MGELERYKKHDCTPFSLGPGEEGRVVFWLEARSMLGICVLPPNEREGVTVLGFGTVENGRCLLGGTPTPADRLFGWDPAEIDHALETYPLGWPVGPDATLFCDLKNERPTDVTIHLELYVRPVVVQ